MAQLSIDLTTLSNFNTVPNGSYTLKCIAKGTGINTPSNLSTGIAYAKGVFTITGNITNGTMSQASSVRYGGNTSVTLSTQYPYVLPNSLTITGVTNYTYDSTTGVVNLTGVINNVVISGACINLLLSPATLSINNDTLIIADDDPHTTNYDIYEIIDGAEVFFANVTRVGTSAS